MHRGNLKAFGVKDGFVSIEDHDTPSERFGVQALYCRTCGHVEFVLK